MPYYGGTVTQPILGGFDELGKMLLQGSAQIAATTLEIEKRRNEQAAQLSEIAQKITATSITQHDKLIQHAARDNARILAESHQANRENRMSLSEVSAIASRLETDNMMMVNSSKVHDENIQRVLDGVEKGDYSSISIDYQNAIWHNDPNLRKEIFKTYAYNPDGSVKVDNTGAPVMVNRPAEEGLQYNRINNVMHVTKFKEVQSVDQNGNPMFDPNTGLPITETKTFSMPMDEFLNPSLKKIETVDASKRVGNFMKNIGNRFSYVDRQTGQITDMPYNQIGQFDSGTMVYGYTLAPQNFADMIGEVEKELKTFTDEQMTAILHDYVGAKADWQPDYKGPRFLDEVNSDENRFFSWTDSEGNIQKIAQYYDINGDALNFTYDPLVLQTQGNGKITLTDEQRELAKAYMRGKYLNAFDVKYKDYKDFINTGNTSSRASTSSYNQASWNQVVNNQIVSSPINSTYLNNKLMIGAGYIAEAGGTQPSGYGDSLLNIHSRGRSIPGTTTLTQGQKIISERSLFVVGGFSVVHQSTPIKTGDAIKNYVTQDLAGTTVTGGKLKSLNNIIFIDEGVDNSGKNVPAMILLEGDVDFAKTAMAAGTLTTGGATASLQRAETKSGKDFYLVDSSELPSLYQMLWKQGSGEKSFRKVLSRAGYNSDAEKGGTQNWLAAFEYYTRAMN